jgi:hypothetical protein
MLTTKDLKEMLIIKVGKIGKMIAYLKTEDDTIDVAYDLEELQQEILGLLGELT